MANHIEPKTYSAGGRTYNAVGQGASTGFRFALLGGLLALGTAVAGVVGVAAATYGLFTGAISLATAAAAALGVITVGAVAAYTWPVIAGTAAVGGAFGVMKGAGRAREQASQEEFKAREQMAYQQTANAIVAQQFMPTEPQMAAAVANDNPYHQAASQIDAATIAHEQTVSGPEVEQVRG